MDYDNWANDHARKPCDTALSRMALSEKDIKMRDRDDSARNPCIHGYYFDYLCPECSK